MSATAMARFPKFAKPNKIITTLAQIEFLLQGSITENFDDLGKGPYFLMIYDFDHLTKFEKKRLQVELFQHPKVVHFRISPEIKKMVCENGAQALIEILESYNLVYDFQAIIHKVQESYVMCKNCGPV